LVCLSDNYRLRLDFPVSVAYVKDIRTGDPVEVRVESMGGKTFSGKITRSALRVNEETRTMITEIEVPNADLELVPGMYAEVNLRLDHRARALAVPVMAVDREADGGKVMVVTPNNRVETRKIALGLETASAIEVRSGLNEGDLVVISGRSSLQAGEEVRPKITELKQ